MICKKNLPKYSLSALFTTAKKWKQPEHSSVDEWLKKIWSSPHGIPKRNEAPTHSMMWVNLENTTLRERSQAHKGHILYDSIYPQEAIYRDIKIGDFLGLWE